MKMKNEERIIGIGKMAEIKENPLIYEEKKIWSKSYSSATAVLFVCWGNICRSPMAEFILKDMIEKMHIKEEFHIESRATHTDEIWNGLGNPVYPPAKSKLAEHGISCKGKRAQLLKRSDYNEYDYIIGMDDMNMKWMCRILGQDVPDRRFIFGAERGKEYLAALAENKITLLMDYTNRPGNVADPWYTRDFETTYNDIFEGCKGFLDFLKTMGKI